MRGNDTGAREGDADRRIGGVAADDDCAGLSTCGGRGKTSAKSGCLIRTKIKPATLPLALKPAPETVTLEIVTLELPALVKVMF